MDTPIQARGSDAREQTKERRMTATHTLYLNISPGAKNQPDGADHRHAIVSGPNADVVISMDATKVTTQSILSSAIAMIQRTLGGGLPK
jgi:hypothetical protein